MKRNASGVTLGAGTDLGQQSLKRWSIIAGGDRGLFNQYSGALGLKRQAAVDWITAHPNMQLTVPQAVAITENTLGLYVKDAQRNYDHNMGEGAFSALSSAQQTVVFDREFNANGTINKAFQSYVYKGDWDGAGSYLRAQATANSGNPLGTRLDAEAKLLGH